MVTDSDELVREGLSSVTKGTLFVLVSTFLWVGLNFVSRVVLVRSINAQWSSFSFGLTLAGVLIAIGALGLPSAVARSLPYASSDDDRRTIVRSTLWIGGVTAVASSVLLFVFAGPIGTALGVPDITLGLQFFPIAVGSGILSTLIASIFQGYEDVVPNALFVQIINPSLFLAFLLVWLVLPPVGITYTEALIAYALANAATLGLLALYLYRRLPKRLPSGPTNPAALPRLMRFTAPLFVVGVMASITGSGDTLVLGIFHPGEVGIYTASLTLSRLLPIGIGAAAYIFLPVASRFVRHGDTASIGVTYATVTKWMILVSLPLFLLFFLLPTASLAFVYGPGYTTQVGPLQITVAGAFLTTLLGPANTAQVAFGQTRLLATNAIVSGVVDVAIAFALVPTFGYVGAAIAWCVANATYSVLCLVEVGSLTGVHPFHWHFLTPFLATAIPVGVALWLLHPHLAWWALPAIGLGIALWFVVAVLVTRSVDDGDRLLLEAVERLVGRPLPFFRRIGRYALRH
ncbi:MAG TPA: polysaccharide biosynthesis C-terminal domain-containing protein [Thermoplasmata archaeon]|nr:polysaccharide biosynthesis C-terminal domain-containing protein [Thermoplasmata archaeon]